MPSTGRPGPGYAVMGAGAGVESEAITRQPCAGAGLRMRKRVR